VNTMKGAHALRLAIAVTMLGVVVGGCETRAIYMGSQPRIEGLGKLVPQQSTLSGVQQTLGQPRGFGKMRHSPDLPVMDVLAYEYVRFKGDQAAISILLVYLDDGLYEGHLWFSAQELIRGLGQ